MEKPTIYFSTLDGINIDMVIETIEKVIEKSKAKVIKYPVTFIKTSLFNEIDEYNARIQSRLNYDLAGNKEIEDYKENIRKTTRFHNFEGRTSTYTAEEIDKRVSEIARRKRKILKDPSV